MAVKLLQVLVLGVIAAAAVDDVPVRWVAGARGALPCALPAAERIPARRPPPPLDAGERPRPKPYVWRKDGEELNRYNSTLEVFRRREPTEGVYQCAARVPGGAVLGYPVRLRFAHIDKQFSVHPANSTAWRGQPYALTCDITSGPPADISWMKDGEPLPDDIRYQLVNNQLIITEVMYEDVGLYRCKATNFLANKTRTSHGGRLQVEEAPADLQTSFLLVHHQASVQVARGSRVVLPCPLLGYPRPALIWELGGLGRRTAELEDTAELLVLNTIADDQAGLYECRVVGAPHLFKRFNVTITSPVNITHPPEWKQVVRASTVRFNCSASGSPAPRVAWYKDGQLLKLQGRISVIASVDDKSLRQLLIRGVTSEDAGVYQCFASNSVSVQSAWARLEVSGGEAAAPSAVRCRAAGARDVLVHWREPAVPVVAYTVLYTGPDNASYPWLPVTEPEAVVNVRQPLTAYSFQVTAYIRAPTGDNNTAKHVSDMSESVTCQGQGVPIKLSKAGDDAILVSWRDFFMEYPGVKQWILQHKPKNSLEEHNVTLDGHIYNYTLNVPPSDTHQVRVLGTRVLPWLTQNLSLVPWTASSAAGHNLRPGEVRAVPEDVEVTEVNARNFTVRWRCEESVPKTYSFLVCTRIVGGNEDCVESHVNSVRVSNLQPESEYEVRVQARLPGQTQGGDFSPPIAVTTASEGQEHFRNLTFRYVNTTTIKVSWISSLKKYTVLHSYDYDLPLPQWTPLEVSGNTVLLTGLDPTKELFVIVKGHEPFGHSPLLRIPEQIPEAKDLKYTYTGDGVTVTWKGGGPRVVRYSQLLTQPINEWLTVNVTHTSVQIKELDPSLHTFVMVAAPGAENARSHVLTIPPRTRPANTFKEAKDLQYTYTPEGVTVTWKGGGPREVRYSQVSQPVDKWHVVNVTHASVQITGLDPSLKTFVKVTAPGADSARSRELTIEPRPQPLNNVYLGVSIACGVLLACAVAGAAVCAWRVRKRARSPRRPRAHAPRPDDAGEEMTNIGDRLANGGGSKDAGEPLLNGHVHITENPSQSKTPNGKVRRQCYEGAFDMTRYDDADVTLETVLDPDTSASTTYHLLDTSRRPEFDSADIPANDSFNKLPDDNMNSELARGDVRLQSSNIVPTLQPNG